MTNPTPHGQVPEALRIADEFRDCIECDAIPSIIDIEKAEAELRRLHAKNERLQQELIRESHRTAEQKLRADQVTRQHADQAAMNREARAKLAALVEAQQPAPSAAADLIAALEEARSAINSMKVEAETAGQGDEQMMLEACETISNEGLQADMAIRAALASAPKPSSTPQADSQPAKVELFNPLEGGNLETELQMAAVIALRDSQPAPVLGTIAHVGTGKTTLTRAIASALRAASTDADNVTAPAGGGQSHSLHTEKCPITGRPFFMTLDHPDLGRVPTYGGPYDSYTIPAPEGEPTDQWHERELRSERYDHDAGWWVEGGEPIPLRIVHEDVLFKLQEDAEAAVAPTPPAQTADSVLEDAARYRFLAGHCRSTSEHWGGRWSIIVDGPAPKSHDSEDDFDAAIDAARAANP